MKSDPLKTSKSVSNLLEAASPRARRLGISAAHVFLGCAFDSHDMVSDLKPTATPANVTQIALLGDSLSEELVPVGGSNRLGDRSSGSSRGSL